MPVPAYRVPVIIARGTLAALTSGLSDLKEGEICYATDSNTLYTVEGGVLTATTADLTAVEIVNDTTPQLGGDLDTNSFQVISTAAGNIQIAPDTTGVLELRGNTGNDAAIQLNCEANTHGVKIKSPPHSAAASYTLVLPENTGATGQALTTDGAGVLSWATPSTVGSIDDLSDVDTTTSSPSTGQGLVWDGSQWAPGDVSDVDLATSSIDDLSDVDTTTTAPTSNQVLAWDGTNWAPADQTGGGGGGAVDSVNGETGVVSLGIHDMDDFELSLSQVPVFSDLQRSGTWSNWMDAHSSPPGYEFPTQQAEWRAYGRSDGRGHVQVATLDDDGNSSEDWVNVVTTGLLMLIAVDGQTYGPIPVDNIIDGTGYGILVDWDLNDFDPSLYSWGYLLDNPEQAPTSPRPVKPFTVQLGYTLAGSSPLPLAEGDILQWNDADQKFKPAQLPAGVGGAVDSVNSETGVVSLGIQDMDDFELQTEAVSVSLTTVITSGTCTADGEFGQPIISGGASGSYFRYYQGGNDYVQFGQLVAGDSITFTFDDNSQHVTTFVQQALNGGDEWYMTVGTSWPTQALTTQTMNVSSPSFDVSPTAPLLEGDTLQWNNADQKFKPAQPAAPVDSVNGETGVVSLGIQEMDDFELQPEAVSVSLTTVVNSGGCAADGEFGQPINSGGAAGSYFRYYQGGNDYVQFEKLTSGDSITFTFDDDSQHITTFVQQAVNGGDEWYMTVGTNWPTQALTTTTMNVSSPSFDALPITPLIEGDILQWVDADQKFKPAQLPEVISKALLQTELAASTDFADFQSRIAAL